MNTRTACLLLAVCTAGAWWPAHAQNTDTSIVKLPQDITYKGLPGAPQHVTLFGDSSQPGLYVDRITFLLGMKVMPHWHPDAKPLEVFPAALQDDVRLIAGNPSAGWRALIRQLPPAADMPPIEACARKCQSRPNAPQQNIGICALMISRV